LLLGLEGDTASQQEGNGEGDSVAHGNNPP
jgi:hypothetical protein